MRINMTQPLEGYTTALKYRVTLTQNAVFEDNGQGSLGFKGIQLADYQFTLRDTAAPLLQKMAPAAGAQNVAVGASFKLTFNEPMMLGSSGNLKLYTTTATTSASSSVCVNNPLVWKDTLGQTCDDYVVQGFCATSPPYGVGPKWPSSFEFSNFGVAGQHAGSVCCKCGGGFTGDDAQPELVLNVSQVNVAFDGTMATIFAGAAGQFFMSRPTTTVYNVSMDPAFLVDAAGNAFAGINSVDYSFAVVDNYHPIIVTYSPANGTTGVQATAPIVLTFNEVVQAGAGNIFCSLSTAQHL